MRRKDEWDQLAEEIVDALVESAGSGDAEEVVVIAKVLRRHHGAEEPPQLSSEEYAAVVERGRIARGHL